MVMVGKDCREIDGILHNDLPLAERKAIGAAQHRAKQIAEIWMDYHFHGVRFPEAAFGYLHRMAGDYWKTWHFYGIAWPNYEDGGEPEHRHYRGDMVDQMVAFLLHAQRKQRLVNGRRPWAYDGVPVIGLGFPISGNNKKRRALSLDVDYPTIKAVRNRWGSSREPDWRDPLADTFLLLHDPAYGPVAEQFAADVEERAQDARLLRQLGALVVPGDTGFQAHFYFKPGEHHGRQKLRPVVATLNSLLHGQVDDTNVGGMTQSGGWENGFPVSLPLPQDRRHLAAFAIDPLIDEFYRGDYAVGLDHLVQEVEAKVTWIGRLSPPPTTRGSSSPASLAASPSAPLPAAPTVGDALSQPEDSGPAPPTGDGDLYRGQRSDHDGIHTPFEVEDEVAAAAPPRSTGLALSKLFLARLDGILDGQSAQRVHGTVSVGANAKFPYNRLDPRGLIWSPIFTKDGTLAVPPDVSLGTIPDGQTNDWLKAGLAHFHSRDEFEQAIAGQGDEKDKLRRYDCLEGKGYDKERERFGISWIGDGFLEAVWREVLATDPIPDNLNKANQAKAVEKRRREFAVACHGLLDARRSEEGNIVMPVKHFAQLLGDDAGNITSFGRRILGPVKDAFFDEVCTAWIDGWQKQTTPIMVYTPNARGQALCDLLPEPETKTRLAYRAYAMGRRTMPASEAVTDGADPEQAHEAMSIWLRRKRAKPRSAS